MYSSVARLSKLHKLLDPEIRAKNVRELKFWMRGLCWDMVSMDSPDPIFVVGCSRSGTTVTYETIGASSQLRSFGYELPELWNGLWGPGHNGWDSEAAGRDQAKPVFRKQAQRFFFQRLGAGQILDKSCINTLRIPFLHALFPQARFVYIQRDGRDNVSSLMDGWREGPRFALGQYLGPPPCEVAIEGGEFREWCFFLPPGWRDYNHASLAEACAYQWLTANRMSLDAKAEISSEQWIQVRYEDIFECPVEMFGEIFERLELPFEESIRERCASLNNRPTSIVSGAPARRKWRGRNREAVEGILPAIAPLMRELGYDID